MRIAFWALLIVALYFVYEYTLGTIFRDYQRCYENTVMAVSEIQGSELNQCIMRKIVYTDANTCIEAIQLKSNIASFLYQASSVKNQLENDYNLHNADCPGNRIDPPEAAFYL